MSHARMNWWWCTSARVLALVLTLGVLLATALPARAGDSEPNVFALTTTNELLTFNESRPDRILSRLPIMGLPSGERILGIDMRPADKQLYAVGSTSQLYTITLTTGMANPIGTPFVIPLDFTNEIGIDFNPVPDRLRIVTDKGQNLRVNPNNGAVVDGDPARDGIQPDGTLMYVSGDRNQGTGRIVGAAYINNVAGATTTTLYDIDSQRDILAIQDPPNSGGLKTVGALGVNASDVVGFDIFTDEDGDNARAAIRVGSNNSTQFFTVNLGTGRVRLKDKGTIGGGQLVRDIAIDLR